MEVNENVRLILTKIKDEIDSHPKTQQELADELAISRGTLYNILKGDSPLTLEFILKISSIYQKPITYFCNNLNDNMVSEPAGEYNNFNERVEKTLQNLANLLKEAHNKQQGK